LSDVYGTDIVQTAGQDWQASPQGDLAVASGRSNLQQALVRRWGTRVGALFYAPDYGNPVLDMLSGPVNQTWLDTATTAARTCLLGDARVADVQVTTSTNAAQRSVLFTCLWTDISGNTGQMQQGVSVGV